MRKNVLLALVLTCIAVPALLMAQQVPNDPAYIFPRFDVAIGYQYLRSNAPPSDCPCFGMNGGFLSASVRMNSWLSIAGEFAGGHTDKISNLGQNLTLMTYTGGPRASWRGHRFVPFAQALFGGAHASDSYFPTATTYTTSATSWVLTAGGGVDYNLSPHLGIRPIEAQFVRTNFNNGSSNSQNALSLGAGIVLRFGAHTHATFDTPQPKPYEQAFQLTCSTNVEKLNQGDRLQVMASATAKDRYDVRYSWSTTGGIISGNGSSITVITKDLPAGDYQISGHAFLSSTPSTTADCTTSFHINTPPPPPTPTPSEAEDLAQRDKEFHENVADALFDYDKYDLRPDARSSIEHAAIYLKDHPSIRVLIGGYADDRGSAEYNLALAEKRANAAREALIASGINGERLQIISYGKEAQVCTQQDEACWQRNRRAAFLMHP